MAMYFQGHYISMHLYLLPLLIRNHTSVLLMELILGMPTYIDFGTLHCILTMYFPHDLGPSIVKLHTDNIFFVQLSHSYVLSYMLYVVIVLSVYLQIFHCTDSCVYVHCIIVIHFQACTDVISNPHKLITSLGLGSGMERMKILFILIHVFVNKSWSDWKQILDICYSILFNLNTTFVVS